MNTIFYKFLRLCIARDFITGVHPPVRQVAGHSISRCSVVVHVVVGVVVMATVVKVVLGAVVVGQVVDVLAVVMVVLVVVVLCGHVATWQAAWR